MVYCTIFQAFRQVWGFPLPFTLSAVGTKRWQFTTLKFKIYHDNHNVKSSVAEVYKNVSIDLVKNNA